MKMLKGIHEIIFYNGDGPGESRRVNINNLKILPQPLGTLFKSADEAIPVNLQTVNLPSKKSASSISVSDD